MVWGPNVEDSRRLFFINCVAAFLSLTGSIWMTYFCSRKPRPWTISMKLILFIAISDIVYSIANIMSAFQDEGPAVSSLCFIEGVLRSCSFVLTLLFATCLGIVCCKSSNFNNHWSHNDQDKYLIKIVLLGAVTCLIFTLS